MCKIKLSNRDHAEMWLEQISNSNLWELRVDPDHKYCLEYMRCGGDFTIDDGKQIVNWNKRTMIDPSGGPYIEVGDTFKDSLGNKYKLVEIVEDTILKLENEGNSSN